MMMMMMMTMTTTTAKCMTDRNIVENDTHNWPAFTGKR
jgi:hypothetical protein